jgi:hypothetical protein
LDNLILSFFFSIKKNKKSLYLPCSFTTPTHFNKRGLISEPAHYLKQIQIGILAHKFPTFTSLIAFNTVQKSNLVGQSIITLMGVSFDSPSQKGSWRFFTRRKQVDSARKNTNTLLAKELTVSHLIAIGNSA